MSNPQSLIGGVLSGGRFTAVPNCYQQVANTSISANRIVPMDHLREPLNQVRFGDVNKTFKISSGSLLGNFMLKVRMPAATIATPPASMLSAENGYGFNLVRNLKFKYGSTQYNTKSSKANSLSVMRNVLNVESRRAINDLAGKVRLDTATTFPSDILYIPLSLPQSCWNSDGKDIPFDSAVLDGDVYIQIDFGTHGEVYSNIDAFLNGAGNKLPEYFDCELVCQSYAFIEQSDSIANSVGRSGDTTYNYNFVDNQQYCERVTGSNSAAPYDRTNVSIAGWQEGNTLGLSLLLVPLRDYAAAPAAHRQYTEITNLIVYIGGQTYMTSNDAEQKLFDYSREPIENYFSSYGGSAATSDQVSPWFDVPLSQYNLSCVGVGNAMSKLEYGMNIDNKTVKFSFNTPQGTAGQEFELFVIQHIQASVSTAKGSNSIQYTSM